jgi:hypothetical protein
MKKHKILDKKRLMKTTTIAMSLLVAAIMVSSSAMSAATSSNADNMNIEIEEESRTVTRQPSLEVTDKNPLLKSGPSLSQASASAFPARNQQEPLDPWDVLLTIEVSQSAYVSCCGGDTEYIYAAEWSGSNIYRFDFEGNYIESFTISGAGNFRDMAYDHSTGYMWSGNGGGVAYEMDLESQTLVSTITGSFQCRAIAYSEDDDWLYMSGWSDPVYIVEKDGTIVDTFDLSLTTSTYGFAYDKWDEAAPLLWVHDQGGTGSQILAYSLEEEKFMEGEWYYHDMTQEVPGGIAGGLALNEWMPGTGFAAFIACSQAGTDTIVCYEGPLTIPPEHDVRVKSIDSPSTGSAGQDMDMIATFSNIGNNSETFDAQMTIIKCEVSDDPLLWENFSSYGTGKNGIPHNWTTDWWKWSSGYQATGDSELAGEVMDYYYDQYYSQGTYWRDYYDNYICSPKINCSGLEKVTFNFAFKADIYYSNYCYLYLKYRQNETSSWRDVTPWENPLQSDFQDYFEIGCYGFQTGGDIGAEFQFNFSYQGYYSYFRYWYLDQCRIDPCGGCAEYAEIVEDITIPKGEDKTVTFPSWTPSEWQNETTENTWEEYPISAEALIEDENPKNDIKYKLIDLWFPWMDDIASLYIEGMASGPAQTFEMDGKIKNVGQNEECCFKTHVEVAEIDYSSPIALFSENFDTASNYYPPSGWTDLGHYYAWTYFYQSYYMPAPYGGGRTPRYYYYYSAGAELISPEIDTTSAGSMELTMAHRIYYAYGYDFIIEVRTDPGAVWAQIQPWDNPVSQSVGPEWITADATIGIGSKTQIRFRGDGYYYDFRYWFLDNLKLTGYAVFDPEFEESKCIDEIDPGEEITLDFDDWTPDFLQYETSGQKIYIVKQWTALEDPPDRNPANDLYQEAITLDYFHDVGIQQVTSPGDGGEDGPKVIWNNGDTDGTNGYSLLGSPRRSLLDDFELTGSASIEQLNCLILYTGSHMSDLTVYFREDDSGDPGDVVATSTSVMWSEVATGRYWFGYAEYNITQVFDPIKLKKGTWWVEIWPGAAQPNCFAMIKSSVWGSELWINYDDYGFMPGSQLFGVQADLSYMLWGGGAISPDVYIRSGTKDIRAIAENIGTFPERDMICYAEIWEFLTNCTNGTLVYEDNITDIDILEPLGGTETLTFDDFNFHSEGLYGLFLNLTDDDDDEPDNNELMWGVGVDETPPSSDHAINPPDPDGENGYYVNDVEITFTASDPPLDGGCAEGSDVNRIEYRIDGGSWQTLPGAEGTIIFGDDGNDVLFEYRAVDNVENEESINSFTIDMDQTTPVMEEISWEAYKESGFWYVDLTASSTDATAGMDRVEFFINNGLQEIIEGSGPDYVFTIQWSEEFRKHSFFFYYYDRAGNMIDQYFDPDNVTAVPHSQTQHLNSITTQL